MLGNSLFHSRCGLAIRAFVFYRFIVNPSELRFLLSLNSKSEVFCLNGSTNLKENFSIDLLSWTIEWLLSLNHHVSDALIATERVIEKPLRSETLQILLEMSHL